MSDSTIFEDFRSHEHWIREAINEAKLAAEKGEVPVGAVVVHQGRIIGRNERA